MSDRGEPPRIDQYVKSTGNKKRKTDLPATNAKAPTATPKRQKNETTQLTCPHCKKLFSIISGLTYHLENKVCLRDASLDKAKNTKKKWICPHCDRNFSRKQCLTQHVDKRVCEQARLPLSRQEWKELKKPGWITFRPNGSSWYPEIMKSLGIKRGSNNSNWRRIQTQKRRFFPVENTRQKRRRKKQLANASIYPEVLSRLNIWDGLANKGLYPNVFESLGFQKRSRQSTATRRRFGRDQGRERDCPALDICGDEDYNYERRDQYLHRLERACRIARTLVPVPKKRNRATETTQLVERQRKNGKKCKRCAKDIPPGPRIGGPKALYCSEHCRTHCVVYISDGVRSGKVWHAKLLPYTLWS